MLPVCNPTHNGSKHRPVIPAATGPWRKGGNGGKYRKTPLVVGLIRHCIGVYKGTINASQTNTQRQIQYNAVNAKKQQNCRVSNQDEECHIDTCVNDGKDPKTYEPQETKRYTDKTHKRKSHNGEMGTCQDPNPAKAPVAGVQPIYA
ncbi:hypothetical protein AG1IA_06307 [Rhizoctonia solani AG-1 IA]|uniref:Uncharacterized protein n=1 Tax=Thanatephorus cucumeris (strain AG1-IA) TaxID=983506 RepID=L8WNB4_THACA|nr:hypothetical protein AG1IA_06307 [Rhizoctonia solani AG-1 IA]